MSDPVAMSLDDYIKSQKKTGKMGFGRRGRGAKPNAVSPQQKRGGGGGGGGRAAGPNRGGQNSFRGRNGRQANKNGQGRWNNGGGNRRSRGGFSRANNNAARGNFQQQQRFLGGGGAVQGQGRRLPVNKRAGNANAGRQQRRQRNPRNRVPQGVVQRGSNQRYFNNSQASLGAPAGNPKRNQSRRLRLRKKLVGAGGNLTVAAQRNIVVAGNRNTKRAVLKLAQKRLQRAKMLVSRKKVAVGGAGKSKKIIAATSNGRLALVKNGFVTVKNTKAKRMERALVQMKIQRAQQARNRISPQRSNIPMPGTSTGPRRAARRPGGNRGPRPGPGRAIDWNTSIVRTMTNDYVDEMTNSQLNPDIQRKIAFIQSRAKNERAPVMPDFKAPVTTSRMKLSDRFRLLRDRD